MNHKAYPPPAGHEDAKNGGQDADERRSTRTEAHLHRRGAAGTAAWSCLRQCPRGGRREEQVFRGISGVPATPERLGVCCANSTAEKIGPESRTPCLRALRGQEPWRFGRFVPWCPAAALRALAGELGGWTWVRADSGCAGRGGRREVCFAKQSHFGVTVPKSVWFL